MEYEINITSLLALRCCFEELDEFWIASNADGFGALDDIIMFKKSNESDQGVAYLMQLKHQDASIPLVKTMFSKDTGDFSFKKYSKCYSDIQKKFKTETENSLLTYLKQNSEMVLIIFTNRSVANNRTDREFLLEIRESLPIINHIGCKGDIFKINYKVLAAEPNLDLEFLKKLYLFTTQPHNKSVEKEIKNILTSSRVQRLQLSDTDVSDIVSKFVKFIGQWSKGVLDGHYPLTKETILKKLVELLLFRYMFNVHTDNNYEKNGEEDIEENEEENIWYHITKDKHVTVIDEPDDVVEEYVKNVTNKIILNRGIFNSITNINRQFMRVVRKFKKLAKSERYELLWKTNKIPLVLEVSDEQGVQYVREVLNQFEKVFRIIILNKTKTRLEEFPNIKSFINISDLSSKHQEYILKKPIKLQGRVVSSIQKLNINKEHCLKSFKVKDIVQILCGQFNVGGQFEENPKFFIEMSLTTQIFDIRLLKGLENIFVVWCRETLLENVESVLRNQLGIDAEKMIRWEQLEINNFKGKIIIYSNIENLQQIEAFCLTLTNTVHFFAWHGGDYVDLIKSNNINNNLENHKKISKKPILANKLLQNFYKTKQTLIVSANPGMGKTVLIHYFALNMPIHLWVFEIPLAKFQDHYKNWEGQNFDSQQLNFERFLKEVLKAQPTLNTEIFNSVFQQSLDIKKVVFLLDGLDEVPVNRQKGAMQLIKFINQSGYYICVTTRPIHQKQVELTLNTFAITLNMFTKNERTGFLRKYFANVGNVMPSNKKVVEFVSKLLEATKSNLNNFDHQFTGVPLQTTLLAEVFSNDFLKYLNEGIFKNQRFDLIYLYEHFINKKIEIACSKFKNVSEDMIECFKECRLLYGLRHIFDAQDLQELKIEENLNLINVMLPDVLQRIQKDGITVIDGDSNVTFVHQTYAEYLVASWLSENINTSHKTIVRKLVMKTFHPNLIVVRNMFDRILANNCPLHTAIINHQLDKVKMLILDDNAFDITDRGGRTILHIISAWGLHHPDRYESISWKIDDMRSILRIILKNKLKHVEDELLHYTPLDYAILGRSLRIANRLALAIQNPRCNINITKAETSCILKYVKKYYTLPLYIVILKCFIRTGSNELEVDDIHKSIRNGDLDRVRSFISEQNVDVPDSEGRTLLHAATIGGHKDIVQFLLAMKANVNQIDNFRRSALHWASYLGHLNITSMLLNNGAEPNTTDCYNLTTYHYVILSSLENQADIVSLLLSRNKTITIKKFVSDKNQYLHKWYKEHPVYLTDLVSQSAILNLMLTHHVNANIKGWKDMTSLMFAAQNNDIDSLELLLTNDVDICARNNKNQTALHYAAKEGHEKVVTILLEKNANINATDSKKQTPLHVAAFWDQQCIAKMLLRKGANVDDRDYNNMTPLHVAAERNNENMVTILLKYGADIEARGNRCQTPLHRAAFSGSENSVDILLTNNADIEAQTSKNETPLYLAAQKGKKNVVITLLKNGANVQANTISNKTPVDAAVARRRRRGIVAILTDAQSKYQSSNQS